MFQRGVSRTGREDDGIVVDAHIFRIDDFVGLHILQHTVLMDARRMGEGIASHDGLVRLHGHVHQRTDHATGGGYFLRVDIRLDVEVVMALENHGNLFLTGIASTFADAVDGHFHLAGAVEHAFEGAGGGHAKVVVAMSGKDGFVNTVNMLHQIFYLLTIFARRQ